MNKIALSQRKMLSPAEVELVYAVPRGSLANLRSAKRGPKYYKVGRRKILYKVADLEQWIQSSPVQTIDSIAQV
jgi:hypothetical protein